jgi:hypothetical protein
MPEINPWNMKLLLLWRELKKSFSYIEVSKIRIKNNIDPVTIKIRFIFLP